MWPIFVNYIFLVSVIIFSSFNGIFCHQHSSFPVQMSPKDAIIEFQLTTEVMSSAVEVDTNLELNIFCRDGEPKTLINYFRTAKLHVLSTTQDVILFKGNTVEEVKQIYSYKQTWLHMPLLLSLRVNEASLSIFTSSCVGISASKPYVVSLSVLPIDLKNVAILLSGLFLFIFGDRISRSVVLFYLFASLFGSLLFGILIIIFITRLLRQFKQSYLIISLIWSLCLYYVGAGLYLESFDTTLSNNLQHLVTYFSLGAAISFLVCYRLGPPKHSKTLDIIRWLIKAFGLLLIYMSSEYVESTLTIIVVSLMFYNAQKLFFVTINK